MLMNEYRLNTMDPEVDPFILQQMEDFFFGAGAALPPGYVPPQGKG
jgi:Fe-S cluster biosynthesis and repair protein YggX